MKRRAFIGLFGAAISAPALPKTALAAPATLGRNKAIWTQGLSLFHARMQHSISTMDLARRLNITPLRAQHMVNKLIAERHITPGPIPGTYRAANPYARNPALRDLAQQRQAQARSRRQQPGSDALFAHVQRLADRYFAAKFRVAA